MIVICTYSFSIIAVVLKSATSSKANFIYSSALFHSTYCNCKSRHFIEHILTEDSFSARQCTHTLFLILLISFVVGIYCNYSNEIEEDTVMSYNTLYETFAHPILYHISIIDKNVSITLSKKLVVLMIFECLRFPMETCLPLKNSISFNLSTILHKAWKKHVFVLHFLSRIYYICQPCRVHSNRNHKVRCILLKMY